MTVPGPTAPPPPTLSLPTVHVHGGTSRRRHALLVLASVVPGLAPLIAGAVAPHEADAQSSGLPPFAGLYPLLAILAARAFPPLARWSRHVSATLVASAWALAAAGASMDRDTGSWSAGAVVVIGVATLVGLWAGWWIAGLRFGVVWPLVRPVPTSEPPTARSAWSERAVQARYVVVLLALGGFAIACLVAALPDVGAWLWTLPAAAFAVLSTLPFAIRVTADRRGLRIRSRILGIPLVTVPIDRIASAAAALIDEAEWGQVGSTADRELTTIVHRSGAALIVTRVDGSLVVVTAYRPDEAAAVLERARRAHERS